MGSSTKKVVQEIPIQYHNFKDVFEKKNVGILQEHHLYDCTIELQDGAQPPFGPIYNLLQTELALLHEYIDENLSKNKEEHKHHLHLILEKLREQGLYAKQEKRLFHQSMVDFLGYIVLGDGISIDGEKNTNYC